MKRLWWALKRVFLVLLIVVITAVLAITAYVSLAPQFGQKPQGEDLERIQRSPHYQEGAFVNTIQTELGSFADVMETLPEFIFGKNLEPTDTIPVKYDQAPLSTGDHCYITWYGHSAFLIEMEGKRILIDPMLTESPSPVPFGSRRFPNEKPIPLEALTDIDLVIISHDHYDHLDYKSIKALMPHTGHFYTALGVGSHLKKWGIPSDKITELDWWQNAMAENIELIACPARHFSGRAFTDGNATQWASWVIKGPTHNLYFSGDGGYGPHFKEIGERYGPFDLAMLECGQYNLAWKDIHMMPEESIAAGFDVQAEHFMPIHWGAFALSVHPWQEPVERFTREGFKMNASIIHPYVGERFRLGIDFPRDQWWNDLTLRDF